MIIGPLVYPFYAEMHLRRGRTVLRPVVPVAVGDEQLVVDALVDTGSEHVLADASLAIAAGISLDDPVDVEEIGLGGGIVEAHFVGVTAWLHPPAGYAVSSVTWNLDGGWQAAADSRARRGTQIRGAEERRAALYPCGGDHSDGPG